MLAIAAPGSATIEGFTCTATRRGDFRPPAPMHGSRRQALRPWGPGTDGLVPNTMPMGGLSIRTRRAGGNPGRRGAAHGEALAQGFAAAHRFPSGTEREAGRAVFAPHPFGLGRRTETLAAPQPCGLFCFKSHPPVFAGSSEPSSRCGLYSNLIFAKLSEKLLTGTTSPGEPWS